MYALLTFGVRNKESLSKHPGDKEVDWKIDLVLGVNLGGATGGHPRRTVARAHRSARCEVED